MTARTHPHPLDPTPLALFDVRDGRAAAPGSALATFVSEYGTTEVLSFERGDLGATLRVERWTPRDRHGCPASPVIERRHARDVRDLTPPRRRFPRGYDERCGWCWGGAAHTEAAHAERIGDRPANATT